MAKIVFTRIDDRLLHGQVSKSWVKKEGANFIVIANDRVAKDLSTQKLMNIATPDYATSIFLTIEETIANIHDRYENKKALILVESPEDAYKLVEANLGIKSINVGDLRNMPGKEKIADDIFIGEEDRKYFNKIHEAGVDLDVRVLYEDPAVDEKELF